MRKHLWISMSALISAPALGHDLWLQPSNFWVKPNSLAAAYILIGHGKDKENWGIRSDRIILFRNILPNGRVVDLRPRVKAGSSPAFPFTVQQPGSHVLAMQSNHAESTLPAARFNEFLIEEGLTPAIRHRAANKANQKAGREIFSRRAKTLIQNGPFNPKLAGAATRRIGFDLEIVPERHPYALGSSRSMPVRVYYQGKPLSGALGKLTNLDADARPVASKRTDRNGRSSFAIPTKGKWLLNVVWTKPISGNPKADFDTTFSSFTFGFPG